MNKMSLLKVQKIGIERTSYGPWNNNHDQRAEDSDIQVLDIRLEVVKHHQRGNLASSQQTYHSMGFHQLLSSVDRLRFWHKLCYRNHASSSHLSTLAGYDKTAVRSISYEP